MDRSFVFGRVKGVVFLAAAVSGPARLQSDLRRSCPEVSQLRQYNDSGAALVGCHPAQC